ncbi:hypothetical protein [Bacillus sp. 1P06AnD]|uniref:hypothetical protein n=1 Tax=Bacillus sp. 1P06AnD TaxID=3132208 RepID=UPI0039A10B5F
MMNNTNQKVEKMQVEDAVAIAQQLERYEQAVKQMKEKLKAYVELNGPIEANGKVWDHFVSASTWEFSAERLKILAGMIAVDGLNPFDYLSISAKDLKRLNYSDQMLSQYGSQKTGNKSFRSVKAENYQKK